MIFLKYWYCNKFASFKFDIKSLEKMSVLWRKDSKCSVHIFSSNILRWYFRPFTYSGKQLLLRLQIVTFWSVTINYQKLRFFTEKKTLTHSLTDYILGADELNNSNCSDWQKESTKYCDALKNICINFSRFFNGHM